MKRVTVFCSSSDRIDGEFVEMADAVGQTLAVHGIGLVFGGGAVGLMGTLARAVHARRGHVTGVIPHALKKIEGIAYSASDELVLTDTMRERKGIMYERADVFLVMPGGYGTLEEFLEVVTLKQLGYHDRRIVLLNMAGYFDSLIGFFAEMDEAGFVRERPEPLFDVISDPGDVIDALFP